MTLSLPISVTVTPRAPALYGGQTQQFAAAVTNTGNTAVTWTLNSGAAGTIGALGLYTAPTTITSQSTVTVTATSQRHNTKTWDGHDHSEPAGVS